MPDQEKLEKAIEWLENAVYNIENIKKGIPLHDLTIDQIKNAIKYLNDEDVDEDVLGKL